MKVVIFAGGFGTRISSEESFNISKPLTNIGEMPIILHIIKIYLFYGHKEFIIACGYKYNSIKKFFLDYSFQSWDIPVCCCNDEVCINDGTRDMCHIRLVDTGLHTHTGERLKRLFPYLKNDKDFFLTYGDGVSDVNINATYALHKKQNALLTLTAVNPMQRFGIVNIEGCRVHSFKEKIQNEHMWINGGFFVCNTEVFDFIPHADKENPYGYMWEQEPINAILRANGLIAYKHYGFWQCMDTVYEKNLLNALWEQGSAPWKCWS